MAERSLFNDTQANQAAKILEESGTVIHELKRNSQNIYNELRITWDSTSARVLDPIFHEFQVDFQKVLDSLQAMHAKLGYSRFKYKETVETQKEEANRVAAAINS